MKRPRPQQLSATFLLALTLASLCSAERGSPLESVELDDHTFDAFVLDHDHVLVLFFDIFQKKSKAFIPPFTMLGLTDEFRQYNVKLVRANAAKHPELAARYHVSELPAVSLFIHGVQIPYDGRLTQKRLLNFVKERMLYSVQEIRSLDEIDTAHDYSVIFHVKSDHSVMERVLRAVKKKYFSINVYKMLDGSHKLFARKEGLVVSRFHDKFVKRYYGNRESPAEIEKFVVNHEYPDFSLYSERTQHWIDVEGLPVAVFLFEGENPNLADLSLNNVASVAHMFKDSVICVLANRAQTDKKIFEEFRALDLSKVWGFIIAPTKPYHKKYVLYREDAEQVLSKHRAKEFFADFKHGILPRFYMTQVLADSSKKLAANLEVTSGEQVLTSAEVHDKLIEKFDRVYCVLLHNRDAPQVAAADAAVRELSQDCRAVRGAAGHLLLHVRHGRERARNLRVLRVQPHRVLRAQRSLPQRVHPRRQHRALVRPLRRLPHAEPRVLSAHQLTLQRHAGTPSARRAGSLN